MLARGVSGQMEFDGETVTITRAGLMPWLIHGSDGRKSIPLKSITAVQYRRCGFYQGYLQLSINGELEGGGGRTHGHTALAADENTILFYVRANKVFERLANAIRDAINDVQAGRPPHLPEEPAPGFTVNGPAGAAASSTAAGRAEPLTPGETIWDELEHLAKARDAGLITPQEFNAKKADLLSRL